MTPTVLFFVYAFLHELQPSFFGCILAGLLQDGSFMPWQHLSKGHGKTLGRCRGRRAGPWLACNSRAMQHYTTIQGQAHTKAAQAAVLLSLDKVAGAQTNHFPDLAPAVPLRLPLAVWTFDMNVGPKAFWVPGKGLAVAQKLCSHP